MKFKMYRSSYKRGNQENRYFWSIRGVFLEVTAGSREQARDSQSESIESLKQKMKSF